MNLETLVERACLESGYNDTDDVAAAEKFARHWDEHIWNYALWKDSLVTCDVSVPPDTNEDHAKGILFLPEVIDRVVAVRLASNQVVVRGQESYYRMDYDAFAATGTPCEFVILPPAWFTAHLEAGGYVSFAGVAADAAATMRIIWENGSGRRTTSNTTIGSGLNLTAPSDDWITVLAAYKPASNSDVDFSKTSAEATDDPNTLIVSGTNYSDVNGTYVSTDGGLSYTNATSSATITYVPETPLWRLDIGEWAYQKSGTSPIGLWSPANYSDPSPTVAYDTATTVAVATFAAADTKAPSYSRIRLLPIPTTDMTVKVLGKAKYEPLDFDQQEPALRNCTNALLAFIRGSLKRRGGENAAAQMEFSEATALLKQVEQIEALQAANNSRFTPEDGFGPEHGIGPM